MIEERTNDDGDVFRYLVLESGSRYSNLDCIQKTEQSLRGVQRWFHRSLETATIWSDPSLAESDNDRLRWLLDDLEGYLHAARKALADREGRQRRAEKIRALRQIAGRTPDEAAAYLAKADELERGEGDS